MLITVLLLLFTALSQPPPDWRIQLRAGHAVIEIPAGIHHFIAPLDLPDYPVTLRGAGIGATELIFNGEGVDGIRARRTLFNGPITIERLTISSSARQGGTAIDIRYPAVAVAMELTVILRDVHIRPSNEGNWHGWRGGGWQRGVVLDHCWGAELTHIKIDGHNTESTAAALKAPTMQIAIDLGNSMAVNINQPKIANASRGIQTIADEVGRAEGLVISGGGYIINVNIGVWAESQIPGGRQIPSLYLSRIHIYAMTHGVVAIGRSAVGIESCELSNSHLADPSDWWFGLYLLNAEYVSIANTKFWRGRIPGSEHVGAGLVALNARHATLIGNIFAEGLVQAAILYQDTSGWRGSGNRYASLQGIIDLGRDNRIAE